jgi:hypothetical protein
MIHEAPYSGDMDSGPQDREFPETTPEYEQEYLAKLADLAGGEVNFDDPELSRKLDTPLVALAWTIKGAQRYRIADALNGLDLTVRDVFAFGSDPFARGAILQVGDKRSELLLGAIRTLVPEFPLMKDSAPPSVLRKLYADIRQVPVLLDSSGKTTIGEIREREELEPFRRYKPFRSFIEHVQRAYNEDASTAERPLPSPEQSGMAGEPIAVALNALRRGFGG